MLVVVVLVLLVLLLVVVMVHCGALPEANQHTVVNCWPPVWLVRAHRQKLISMLSWIIGGLFGLFIGSVRRLLPEASQHAVVDYWRPVWLVLALLLACAWLEPPLACW